MSYVIDFHTHFFSRTFFEALAAESPLEGSEAAKLKQVAEKTGVQIPDADVSAHLTRWLDEMERYGVHHLVSFASVPQEVPVLAEVAQGMEGKLTPFAIVNPLQEEAPARVRELIRGPYQGFLFFPAMHGYAIDDPRVGDVLAAIEERHGVAVVHCGMLRVGLRDHFGLARPAWMRLANPLHLIAAANAHPGVHFVIPHFGAGMFRETLMAGQVCDNVYVDTSSAQGWMATQSSAMTLADVFDRALGVFGSERILFGTDSSVFPRGWRQDILTTQREALGACGLSEAERGQILHGNALRILRAVI